MGLTIFVLLLIIASAGLAFGYARAEQSRQEWRRRERAGRRRGSPAW